jgi:hypothetical protein
LLPYRVAYHAYNQPHHHRRCWCDCHWLDYWQFNAQFFLQVKRPTMEMLCLWSFSSPADEHWLIDRKFNMVQVWGSYA